MYEIEKGIPIPEASSTGKLKYPWPMMEHGDCITFMTTDEFKRARGAATSWVSRHGGFKVKARQLEEGGGRIWFEETTDA